jgi:CO/xanthine dehydrogenase Mo-binding subunit
MKKKYQVVGKDMGKIDSLSLAKGKPLFTDDIPMDGLLHVKFLWSPHAHANIKSINYAKALKLSGVHEILCYKNVPRIPHTTAGQGYPEPSPYDTFIFDKKVRFVGDRVCCVAAESEEIAWEALRNIKVEYEILPAVFNPERALEAGAPILHDQPEAFLPIPVEYDPKKNLVSHVFFEVGDVGKNLEKSALVVEGRYESHYSQHCPIEPHIATAYFEPLLQRLVIRTSTQVPFHVRRIVAQALNFPLKKIRVIKPRIGGGFGCKQEVFTEQVVALLALRTKRPVQVKFTRMEEFVSARTRHPQIIDLKVAATKEGLLTGIDMNVVMNTGAYGSHGLTVLTNTGSKTLPLYKWNNIRFKGRTAYTNLPVGGAYRGYGGTQGAFAIETALDEIAFKLGIDPTELRLKNHIGPGESSPVFKALGEGKAGVEMTVDSVGLDQCIIQGREAFDWDKKFKRPKGTGRIRRGVGMVTLMQGSSIPGIDMGSCWIKMNDDGSFNLNVGATDIGTGSDTILSQIAAEVLHVDLDDIIILSSDTDLTPFDVGAYASSTTYLSGNAVVKGCQGILQQIVQVASAILNEESEDLSAGYKNIISNKTGKEISYREIALYSLYEKDQFQIQAVGSHITHKSPPPFAAHFVEIEVDMETGKVKVLNYLAAVDCGTAINPILAEGQIEGAILNGISFALTEEFIFNSKGKVLNTDFNKYKIFTVKDMPSITTLLIPTYEETGPFGAKSVSEICINGPMPAISNAIFHATGLRLVTPPFSSEKVFNSLATL